MMIDELTTGITNEGSWLQVLLRIMRLSLSLTTTPHLLARAKAA